MWNLIEVKSNELGDLLEYLTVDELRTICDTNGLKKPRKKRDLIAYIKRAKIKVTLDMHII